MLATIMIASREKTFFGVWLGSTTGQVVSNALAIAAAAVGRGIDFHGQAFGTYGQGENKNTQEANDESGD